MNTPVVECVLEADNHLGETPLWSTEEQVLYWVNCEQPFEIHRLDPTSGAHDIWPMPLRVGGIVLAPRRRGSPNIMASATRCAPTSAYSNSAQ